jgi:hypothetical protein
MSQELIQKIIGREITSPPFKVEAQHMIAYTESVGVFDPKYREIAFPGYVCPRFGIGDNKFQNTRIS